MFVCRGVVQKTTTSSFLFVFGPQPVVLSLLQDGVLESQSEVNRMQGKLTPALSGPKTRFIDFSLVW